MLQDIRDNSQGVIAKIIVGVICAVFALFGVESILGGTGSNHVGKVNGEKISAQDLNEAIYLKKRQLLAQMGENVQPEMLEDDRLRQPALDSLVQQKLMLQAAADNNMQISEAQLNLAITQTPEFQEDGKFSNERFKSLIAGSGMTGALYKKLIGQDLLMKQYASGFADTGFVTSAELAVSTQFSHQSRDIRYITLNLKDTEKNVELSDESIKQYYDENPDQFQSEESVILEYLTLEKASFIEEVSEEDLKQAFDEELAVFETNEQREVAHILIELGGDVTEEQAKQTLLDVKAKAEAGEDFAALAKEYSNDFGSKEFGGALGILNEDAFPEEFVTAAKSLKTDELSQPVVTDSGVHLIKLTNLQVDEAPTYEDRKESLKDELQQAKAEPAFWAAVEELKDSTFNAADLSEPAAGLDKDIQESSLITRAGNQGLFSNSSVIRAAFSDELVKDGQNSDVIELSEDQVIVLRVKEHNAPALLEFDEVKAQAESALRADEAEKLLVEQAKTLSEKIQTGADVKELAGSEKLEWQVMLAATRSKGGDREILDAAFKLPKADEGQRAVDSVRLRNGNYAVLAVDNVKDGSGDAVNDIESSAIKRFMSSTRASGQFQQVQEQLEDDADIDLL